jgi:hypothetical protein
MSLARLQDSYHKSNSHSFPRVENAIPQSTTNDFFPSTFNLLLAVSLAIDLPARQDETRRLGRLGNGRRPGGSNAIRNGARAAQQAGRGAESHRVWKW